MNYEGPCGHASGTASASTNENALPAYGLHPNNYQERAEESRRNAVRALNRADRYSYDSAGRRNELMEAQVWATIYAGDVETAL